VKAGDALRQALSNPQLVQTADLGIRLLVRLVGSEERVLGILQEDPCERAVGAAEDLATGRIRGCGRDADPIHGADVVDARMTARVSEVHRVVGRDAAELVVNREATHVRLGRRRPLVLVPATTEDPATGLGRIGSTSHPLDDLVPAPGLGEIEIDRGPTDLLQVSVRLDEAGNRKATLEVDDLGRGSDPALDLVVATHSRDPIPDHRHGLGLGHRLVERHHPAAAQHEIRALPTAPDQRRIR